MSGRFLFVTPSEVSSGEAVTALHMAADLAGSGAEVRFLASPFTARLMQEPVDVLGPDLDKNLRTLDGVLARFQPDTVVFADYPLLFFANGVVPLAGDGRLERLDARVVTLDHLGYAQRPGSLFFGPPHLSFHAATFPALADGMQVLLPCPSNDPRDTSGRRGVAFRYWTPPVVAHERGQNVVIVHATPQWAWRMAEQFRLPYYRFLTSLLEQYLGDLPVPVTVLSVNNGGLLSPSHHPNLRVVNTGPLPAAEYERLLLTCDLLLSENGVSVSIGKAVCGQVPCALLRNSFGLAEVLDRAEPAIRRIVQDMEAARLGSVFPYEVFPLWRRDEVPLPPVPGCTPVEVFGGEPSRSLLHALLLDEEHRAEVRATQQAYAERVAALPGPAQVLSGAS